MKTATPEKILTGMEQQERRVTEAIAVEQERHSRCLVAEVREEELSAAVGRARAEELEIQRRTTDPAELLAARQARETAEYEATAARRFAEARSAELDRAKLERVAAQDQLRDLQQHVTRLRAAIPSLGAEAERLEHQAWQLEEERKGVLRLRADRLASRAAYENELKSLTGEN